MTPYKSSTLVLIAVIVLAIAHVPMSVSFTEKQFDYPNLLESQQVVKTYVLYQHESQMFAAIKTYVFKVKHAVFLSKTRRPIFCSKFTFKMSSDHGRKGIDATPDKEELNMIETRHYINPDQDAALSLNTSEAGVKIVGVMQNVAFVSMENSNDTNHPRTIAIKIDNTCQATSDFMETGRKNTIPANFTYGIDRDEDVETVRTFAQVRVFVVVDFELFSNIYRNNIVEMIDYIAVMMHAINNRFGFYIDPRIRFTVAGVFAASPTAKLYFIQNNILHNSTRLNLKNTLIDFSKWLFENKATNPEHDLALLLLGKPQTSITHDEESTGHCFVQGFIRGACYSNAQEKKSYAAVVAEDNGLYSGFRSIAHQFAHSLGIDHDGSASSWNCSDQDGYAMSSNGFDMPHHSYFSLCSLKSMKYFIESTEGSCLRINDPDSSQNPFIQVRPPPVNGEQIKMLNLSEICKKRLNTPDTIVAPLGIKFASFLCRNLVCDISIPVLGATTKRINLFSPVPENTPCGKQGGYCLQNECVNQTDTE